MTGPRENTPSATAPAEPIAPSPSRCARSWVRQLVLLPLALVVLFGTFTVGVSWWWYASYDAHCLVRDLRTAQGYDWPKAYALSQCLRNPAQAALKDDAALCHALASLLVDELRRPSGDLEHLRFQAFLCRAVGEFRLPLGVPVLLDAVRTHRDPDSLPVRIAALEALAVLAGQLEASAFTQDPRAVPLLIDATRVPDGATADPATVRAAATATFALGIVGGPVALEQLRALLNDPRADVRHNAATGLARHGVAACIPVLVTMLDTAARRCEESTAGASAARGQQIRAAARALRRLAQADVDADFQPARDALRRVASAASTPADVQPDVLAAERALQTR